MFNNKKMMHKVNHFLSEISFINLVRGNDTHKIMIGIKEHGCFRKTKKCN